ncbi:MAG: arsenate reductase ArsC [Chloroflexi bacterium]|nr:arsenate reductase ArsC [Chloroflexota bacterium]
MAIAKKTVLFLCTGNSCRSQMAEGLVNGFLGESWQAFSAGTNPAIQVHPLAIQVMHEIGLDISQHTPKQADYFMGQAFDVVITVCDDAAENCPIWLGQGRKQHIGFDDPAAFVGTPEETLVAFRQVRDSIQEQISQWLRNFNP